MPGPMSIPNGTNPTVTIVEIYEDGERVERRIPLAQLTGEQRARLASRGRLSTGKTEKRKNGRT